MIYYDKSHTLSNEFLSKGNNFHSFSVFKDVNMAISTLDVMNFSTMKDSINATCSKRRAATLVEAMPTNP